MAIFAQIGIGSWGQNHIRALSKLKGCDLKICCDKEEKALKRAAELYGRSLKTTRDYKDILKDKEIEAVIIATPASTHTALAMEALSAGKHVFIEKPLALNVEDGIKVKEKAEKEKKIVMVGHLLLYHPAIRELKKYFKNGELGEIYYIYSTRVNLGKIRAEENALWSLAAHDISVALFLLEDLPEEVSARGESYIRKGVADVVFATLKFRNNITVQLHVSWLDPHKIRKFTVVGSKKMAVFDDMQASEKIRIYDKGIERKVNCQTYEEYLTLREGSINIPSINMKEPLQIEFQHFIDCINNGTRPLTDCKSSLDVLKVLEAAQGSMDNSGKSVKIKR